MGSLKAELYKLLYNKFIYLSIFIIISITAMSTLNVNINNRLEVQIYYSSFLFLIISGFIVGSIITSEYNSTMKEIVMAINDRKRVYLVKLFSVFLAISIIYFVYTFTLVLTNKNININLLINQYIAIMVHTITLMTIAYIIKMHSALFVVISIMLCIYRELSLIMKDGIWEIVVKSSYFIQFSNDSLNYSCIIFQGILMFLCIICGYIIFNLQEIK